jgi:hypothetical protein
MVEKKSILRLKDTFLAEVFKQKRPNLQNLNIILITLPRNDKTLPRSDKTLPRGDKTLPRGDKTLPRGDKTLPRGDKTLPRSDKTLPRSDKTLPRSDNVLRLLGNAAPCPDRKKRLLLEKK